MKSKVEDVAEGEGQCTGLLHPHCSRKTFVRNRFENGKQFLPNSDQEHSHFIHFK